LIFKLKTSFPGRERVKIKNDLFIFPRLGLDLAPSLSCQLKGLPGGLLSQISPRRS